MSAEPAAWEIVDRDGLWLGLCRFRKDAEETVKMWANVGRIRSIDDVVVVPLYRSPQTCPYVVGTTTLHCSLTPLTITDEEREAIADAASRYVAGITPKAQEYAATLRGLLERTK